MSKKINVAYTLVEGIHFFKSADARVEGLCAASSDPRLAYEEVTAQLRILLGSDHISPVVPFEKFLDWLSTFQDTREAALAPIPAANVGWSSNGAPIAA